MAFAAGAIVFPGGRIDEDDRLLARQLGRPDEAAKVTAIRETIEESGVIAGLKGPFDPDVGRAMQDSLSSGSRFGELLAARGLAIDFDGLVPFTRWMPAFKHARRFDTLFYLARAPEGRWIPSPQEGECVSAEWASPRLVLEQIERGEASAIFPTKRNLERLAGHSRAHSLETIIPWIEEIGGEPHVRIPDDRGYPVTSEPLATAFRA